MNRAKARGTKSGKPIGRPVSSKYKMDIARQALIAGQSVREAAAVSKLSVGKVWSIRKELKIN